MRKKLISLFFYTAFFYLSLINYAHATLNLSSRNSAINLSGNTSILIGSPNDALIVEGTISKDSAAQIEGNRFNFAKGVIENNDTESMLSATYDPTNPDTIYLTGDSFIDSEPGTILQRVEVRGTNNRLEGQPLFISPIIFQDSNTTLTIALQNTLNQNINLAGGILQLSDELKLADNVKLTESGVVKLNNFRFSLGSFYSSPWTTNIIWDHATDIVLNGRTALSGEWVFVGENRLNGNGNVLDLTQGGTIRVAPNSTLHLTDVHLRGVGDNKFGKLILDYDNSQARLYNVDVELVNNFTTTVGGIYVEGPTTFILKEHNWTFSYNALLTVDGVSLWLDCLDRPREEWPHPGQLQAPLPLFIDYNLLDENLRMDLKLNLDLINRGTVREVANSTNLLGKMPCSDLTGAPIVADLNLETSCHIHPVKRVEIAGNVTINGQGATVVFSNPTQPQFIVNEGCTVTLKNIELDRVNDHTFDLKWRAYQAGNPKKWYITEGQINIGENVVLGLEEDVTLSHGLLNLIRSTNGDTSVLHVRGVDGKHRLILNPTNAYKTAIIDASYDGTITGRLSANDDPVLIKLNDNTMGILAIDLWNIEHISSTVTDNSEGLLGLFGQASVNFKDFSDLAFSLKDVGNQFRLLNDELNFSGKLLFDTNSELKIVFVESDSKMIFVGATNIDLEQNTILSFAGKGTAKFGNGSVINLNGTSSFSTTQPNLIVQETATLSPADNATMVIKGIGIISMLDAGKIEIANPGTIIVGDAQKDEIDLNILGNGMLRLKGTTLGNARMSLQKGTFNITVANGGSLAIDNYGWLEINSLNRVPAAGNFKALKLDPHGQLSLNYYGKISFTSNAREYEDHKYIIWEGINTLVSGAVSENGFGVVEYINPVLGFEGRLQPENVIFSSTGLSAEQLVRTLVNQLDPISNFPTATLITDSNDANWIRLRNYRAKKGEALAVKTKVVSGDTFIEEDTDKYENGAVIGVDEKRNQVVYWLNGTRDIYKNININFFRKGKPLV